MNQKTLLPAIEQGKIARATIDDKVRRILRTAVRFGWLDRNQTDMSITRYNRQGRQAALEAARGSMVLLKNEGELLPLVKGKIKSLAVIGPNAYPAVPVGGGSARVEPFAAASFMEGLSDFLGASANVYYHAGIPTLREVAAATAFSTAAVNGQPGLQLEVFDNLELAGKATLSRVDRRFGPAGAAADEMPRQAYSARWSGYYIPQDAGVYDICAQIPGEGLGYRLYMDDKLLLDGWHFPKALVSLATINLTTGPHKFVFEMVQRRMGYGGGQYRIGIARRGSLVDPDAIALAKNADAVVLAVGYSPETESEGGDRTFQLPFGQEELIREIAAANKKTIVVITSGGSVDMNAWLEEIPALIEAWYPGQEGSRALAEILFGDINPSGRLPVTFERRWEDNPVHDSYYPETDTNWIVYKEGVFLGYRGYERNGTKPLFPFGYGLSYTSFKYDNLSIRPLSGSRYEIAFDITNTGKREGADIAQIYVGAAHPKIPRPAKELKGVAKINLRPGERQRVSVTLGSRAFSYYDVNAKQWRADPGEFDVFVGRSSQQIELRDTIVLASIP
jgi:beta-glucosidase